MPFIPFIVGAAVGVAATYVAKDDSKMQLIKDTGGKITGSVGAVTDKVTGMFKKSKDEVAEEVVEVVDDAKETVAT